MPTTTTLIGYIASGLVLTTFWTNDLRRPRILAILSNIAFISYGALVWLPPVLGLHLLLLPLNTVRLMGMPRAAPGATQRELPASRLAMLADRARRSASAGRNRPSIFALARRAFDRRRFVTAPATTVDRDPAFSEPIKAEPAPNIVIARRPQSKSPFRGTYTVLLSAALSINLCLLAGHISGDLFRIPDVPGFPASVNLFTAILVRNELFLNALYRVLIKCCSPAQIPIGIKHTVTSSLLHIGGIHAGCAAASLIWLSFGMLSLLSQDAAEKKYWALFLVLGGIIVLLAVMCITAAPMVRSRYHNFFEIVHRFFGWCALLLMWMMLLLATSWGPRSAASASQLSATECISFGLAVSIAALILAPWLTVRKVTVHTRILSRSIIQIKFAGSSGPGMFGRISRHALGDWHAFALVPGGRGAPSHSMVISAIGDFTRGLVTNPPEKLYVRAIKFPGLPSCVPMYQRSIIIATGAGMAPYLSVLPVLSRERHRLIWVGRAFRECFGQDFCDMVFAWPDLVLVDTTKVGRPDLLALAAENYRSFGADAVFVGSNPEGTREIVSGCRELGIPAFGPSWDS